MTLEDTLALYDFDLPEARIALRPCEPRDACQLLMVRGSEIADHNFLELPSLLREGDLLIGNDTKVIPALLFGVRPARDEQGTDVNVQVNLLEALRDGQWRCLCKPGRRLKQGDIIRFGAGLSAEIVGKDDEGGVLLAFDLSDGPFWDAIDVIGAMPIPPYIAKKRPSDEADHADYQTVFANEAGSVAAPTAGLHFTDRVMSALKSAGIGFETVTLHVGAGTFAGLTEENLETGKLHSEVYDVRADVLAKIRRAKKDGRRVIAVGTTALRTLESIADDLEADGHLSGSTNIFIRPGYRFRVIDGLITNFHLPKSSLFMLVSALCGVDVMQRAYAHAIEKGYNFYSYGDASLLLPQHD